MRGINKVILIGHLGRDPEVKRLDANTTVAKFSLATTEPYKTKDGNWAEQTEWHNIVMWRQLAERAERDLRKGMPIYIEGKIRSRSWDDKEGNKRYVTEIVADIFSILERRNNDQEHTHTGNQSQQQTNEVVEKSFDIEDTNDGLPF